MTRRQMADYDFRGGQTTIVWNSEASHAASLTLPAVTDAIARARPLIVGLSNRVVTRPIGGVGLSSSLRETKIQQ